VQRFDAGATLCSRGQGSRWDGYLASDVAGTGHDFETVALDRTNMDVMVDLNTFDGYAKSRIRHGVCAACGCRRRFVPFCAIPMGQPAGGSCE
jgi:hypothetical protein